MYRKFRADHIFNGHEILPAHFVLITGNAGTVIEIVDTADAGDDIETFRGMLCPGFINAHCHLELSHMKGVIPEKTGLTDFILKVVFERHFEEATILTAIEKAEKEMLQNGIVAVGDICNNTLTITQKTKRRLRYHNFIETSGFPPGVAEKRFQQMREIYNAYKIYFPASSIVPHAPYSVSASLFKLINLFADNKVISIHNQETAAENELFINKTGAFTRMFEQMNIDISFFEPSGKASLQTYLPLLQRQQSLILVHNVCTSKTDIDFEKEQSSVYNCQTYYCLCPNANLYITDTLPDVNLMMKEECNIVLGTDSLASNHQLSIWEEVKTLHENFPKIAISNLLQWATFNGAKALHMEQELGSFEKGKNPGIVLLDGVAPDSITQNSTAKRIL